jgi:hypothetical protein
MQASSWRAGLLAVPLVLAGCAGAATQPTAAPSSTSSTGASVADAQPSRTAAMVCGDDVVGDVSRALSLPGPPRTTASWADPLFTCDYDLPMGPLVLSVQESADPAAALADWEARRAGLGDSAPAPGLGERAYATPAGTVVVVKDAMTLTVDATGLPEVFGVNGQRRSAFAYEVASIVLGCWTGHE